MVYVMKSILKFLKDCRKPYKSNWHRNRDLLMFLLGLKNIISGSVQTVANIVTVSFFACIFVFIQFPLSLFWLMINKDSQQFVDFIKGIIDDLGDTVFHSLVDNLLSVISGLAMMLASPMALLRTPFRMFNTPNAYISILNDPGLRTAISEVTDKDISYFDSNYGRRFSDVEKQVKAGQCFKKITRVYSKLKKAQEQHRPDSDKFELDAQVDKAALLECMESDKAKYLRVFNEVKARIQPMPQ